MGADFNQKSIKNDVVIGGLCCTSILSMSGIDVALLGGLMQMIKSIMEYQGLL